MWQHSCNHCEAGEINGKAESACRRGLGDEQDGNFLFMWQGLPLPQPRDNRLQVQGEAQAGVRPLSVDITNCNTTGKAGQHSCNLWRLQLCIMCGSIFLHARVTAELGHSGRGRMQMALDSLLQPRQLQVRCEFIDKCGRGCHCRSRAGKCRLQVRGASHARLCRLT